MRQLPAAGIHLAYSIPQRLILERAGLRAWCSSNRALSLGPRMWRIRPSLCCRTMSLVAICSGRLVACTMCGFGRRESQPYGHAPVTNQAEIKADGYSFAIDVADLHFVAGRRAGRARPRRRRHRVASGRVRPLRRARALLLGGPARAGYGFIPVRTTLGEGPGHTWPVTRRRAPGSSLARPQGAAALAIHAQRAVSPP
jgi:hypothetical protein